MVSELALAKSVQENCETRWHQNAPGGFTYMLILQPTRWLGDAIWRHHFENVSI
jgi:hypothetical protein